MKQIESTYQSSPKSGPVAELITSHSRLWEYMGNAVLALWSLSFFIALLVDFNSRHRVSSLLMVIFDGALVWVAVTSFDAEGSERLALRLERFHLLLHGSLIFFLRPAPADTRQSLASWHTAAGHVHFASRVVQSEQ